MQIEKNSEKNVGVPQAATPHATCKICRGNATYLCTTHSYLSDTDQLHHYRCLGCGFVFVGNDIKPEELGVAYSKLNSETYYQEIRSENRAKMLMAAETIEKLAGGNKALKVIDLGTGDGTFPVILKEKGFTDVAGHEITGADLSLLKKNSLRSFQDFDYKTVPSNEFDIVTLLDVAEHVLDPIYLFEQCSRILRPGGIVYFHTPVVTRLDRVMHLLHGVRDLSRVSNMWQAGRTSILHLENYSQRSLQIMLEKSGFKDIEIKFKNELSWPVYMYVRTYLTRKRGLPDFTAKLLAPFFYPIVSTKFFNANKSIVRARKK